ncbi:MAG: hypothetical protein SW127_14115, partial [Actinomycetota bacterium]|nr:hypothetical protein [Actinomycetota bacterium]
MDREVTGCGPAVSVEPRAAQRSPIRPVIPRPMVAAWPTASRTSASRAGCVGRNAGTSAVEVAWRIAFPPIHPSPTAWDDDIV